MKLLATRLGCQKAIAKSLVIGETMEGMSPKLEQVIHTLEWVGVCQDGVEGLRTPRA